MARYDDRLASAKQLKTGDLHWSWRLLEPGCMSCRTKSFMLPYWGSCSRVQSGLAKFVIDHIASPEVDHQMSVERCASSWQRNEHRSSAAHDRNKVHKMEPRQRRAHSCIAGCVKSSKWWNRMSTMFEPRRNHRWITKTK